MATYRREKRNKSSRSIGWFPKHRNATSFADEPANYTHRDYFAHKTADDPAKDAHRDYFDSRKTADGPANSFESRTTRTHRQSGRYNKITRFSDKLPSHAYHHPRFSDRDQSELYRKELDQWSMEDASYSDELTSDGDRWDLFDASEEESGRFRMYEGEHKENLLMKKTWFELVNTELSNAYLEWFKTKNNGSANKSFGTFH